MWIVELLVVLFLIWLGARLGSIAIGFAGGFGVLVLAMVFGIAPGSIPVDVILIIMSVIAAIAAVQVAGGLGYMVHLAERILHSNPRYIIFMAPVLTYTMTLFAGTGHTAFSTLPVIAEVPKETGVRPFRPLFISTVPAQIAITASPISAAVIFFSNELEPLGCSSIQLLMISIPSSFMLTVATLIAIVCKLKVNLVLDAATFKSGMSDYLCVLGVAWLGTTFVAEHLEQINMFAGSVLETKPWLLAVVLFFAAMLLYSQAATTRALMPAALTLGVGPVAAIAAFASVSALFVLPTYPSLLAAVEFDDTGSTRIGKCVFDHPFLIPGTTMIIAAVILGFVIGPLVI